MAMQTEIFNETIPLIIIINYKKYLFNFFLLIFNILKSTTK